MNLGAPAKLSKGFIALLARLCSSTACKHQHGGLEGRVQQQQQPQAAPPPASRQPFPLPEDVLLHVLGFQSLNERCEEGSSSPPPTGLPLAAAALRRHLSARNLVAKTSPAPTPPLLLLPPFRRAQEAWSASAGGRQWRRPSRDQQGCSGLCRGQGQRCASACIGQLTGLTHLALGLSCFHPTSWRQLPELAGLSSQLQSLHLLDNPDMPVRIQTYTGHTDPYMRRGAAGCVTASATCAS